jgi:hypothetical protein
MLATGMATPGYAQDGFVQQNGASLGYNVFDKVRVRLNISSQEVHILDRNNTEIALARGYIKEVLWPHDSKIRFQNGFPPVDNQVANFIDSHKLKIKSADDVKQVVDYYNTLP